MSNSSQTRVNGCVFTECIVPLPCPRKVVPKSRSNFYMWFNDGEKQNAVPKKRVGGKKT